MYTKVSGQPHCIWCVCVSVFQIQELSASLGIPVSGILPVKNYSQELELNQNTDILILSALDQMLNYADSFFENQPEEEKEEL